MNGHPLISCDDHRDLDMLPADLWTARMPDARHRTRHDGLAEHCAAAPDAPAVAAK